MNVAVRTAQVQELRDLLQKRRPMAAGHKAGRLAEPQQCVVANAAAPWQRAGWLTPGSFVEWIAGCAGTGALELAWAVMRRELSTDSRVLLVDPLGELYPLALARCGVDLNRAVWVRGSDPQQALWVIEQGLRSRGVDLVWGRLERLSPVAGRRLKFAAETGGARCVLLREEAAIHESSVADVRLVVVPQPSPDWGRRRLTVDIVRWKSSAGTIPHTGAQLVEHDHETGDVRLVSELADPAGLHLPSPVEEVWRDPAHVA